MSVSPLKSEKSSENDVIHSYQGYQGLQGYSENPAKFNGVIHNSDNKPGPGSGYVSFSPSPSFNERFPYVGKINNKQVLWVFRPNLFNFSIQLNGISKKSKKSKKSKDQKI